MITEAISASPVSQIILINSLLSHNESIEIMRIKKNFGKKSSGLRMVW